MFEAGQARTVIAIELPKSHAMMHLDTVMTMIDRGTFVLYPYIDRHPRSWSITRHDPSADLTVTHNRSLWDALAEALAVGAGQRFRGNARSMECRTPSIKSNT